MVRGRVFTPPTPTSSLSTMSTFPGAYRIVEIPVEEAIAYLDSVHEVSDALIYVVIYYGTAELAKYVFKEKGIEPQELHLRQAISAQRVPIVRLLIRKGVALSDGTTGVMHCTREPMLKMFLEIGEDIDARDNGYTALMRCAPGVEGNRTGGVIDAFSNVLLEHGADPFIQGPDNRTFLDAMEARLVSTMNCSDQWVHKASRVETFSKQLEDIKNERINPEMVRAIRGTCKEFHPTKRARLFGDDLTFLEIQEHIRNDVLSFLRLDIEGFNGF